MSLNPFAARLAEEFILTRDEDSHWYVIPVERETEFAAWAEGGYATEPQPVWAERVGGAPSLVKFTGWRIG